MMTLWSLCRGPEGGYARLPDDGGVNDQSAFVMSAFNVLSSANAGYQEWVKSTRNG